MPTENRSSNTEMVSVLQREDRYIVIKRSDLERISAQHRFEFSKASRVVHERMFAAGAPARRFLVIESDWPEYEPTWAAIERRVTGSPAPHPHPEPIAWMVGTAIWWTKEEAERDAAETGLPIVGLGPMTGTGTIEQHQGEPLPITRDMNRLMEACRIGEFKDEGGSETVEALAVASLDAKSSMGHDADSYMAGYSAALYEQVEPFIWMSLSSQFQRDPVAWRGINELGEVVTEWIDGSPPPSMVDLCGKPASFAKIELAYTNADPAEVERLRRFEAAYLEWSNKTDWVQQTAAPKELGMHRADVIKQRFDTLRAQLAERDALLRMQDSLLEEAYQYDIGTPLKRKIRAVALSASAEPSAPAATSGKCLDGGDCGIGGTCKWCPHTTASAAQQPS